MTLTATARSIAGTLRQEVLVDGRHLFETDEPVEVGGDGTAASPHELIPAALAACVSTTIVMAARARGWEIGEVEVDVDYDHRASPRTAAVVVRIEGELTPHQIGRLEKAAAACPVRRALEASIHVEERLASRHQ